MYNEENEQISEEQELSEEVNEEVEEQEELANQESLQKEIKDQKEKYLRLYADFDNYKKRSAKERLDLISTAGKDVIISILPIVDDCNRAIEGAKEAKDVASVREGMILVKNKMYTILEQLGVQELDAMGQEFDAEIHEAITEVPAPSKDMKGKVIDQVEKGYTLHGKLIRHPKVVVGK